FPAGNGFGAGCSIHTYTAVNATDFKGPAVIQIPCGGAVIRTCQVRGVISGNTMVGIEDSCRGSFTGTLGSFTGTFNSTFSSFTTTITFSNGQKVTSTFFKGSSTSNISQSSGIGGSIIKTTGLQWIDYNGDKRLDLFLVGSNGVALFKNV